MFEALRNRKLKSTGESDSPTRYLITGSEDCVTAMVFARLRLLSETVLNHLLEAWGWEFPFPPQAEIEYWPRFPLGEEGHEAEPDLVLRHGDGPTIWIVEVKWGGAPQKAHQLKSQRAAVEQSEGIDPSQIHQVAIGDGAAESLPENVCYLDWSRLPYAVEVACRNANSTSQDSRVLEDLKAIVKEIGLSNIEFQSLQNAIVSADHENAVDLKRALEMVRESLPAIASYQQRQLDMLRQINRLVGDRYEFVQWYRVPELRAPSQARKEPWSRSYWDLLHLVGIGIHVRSRDEDANREHVCFEVLLDPALADREDLWKLNGLEVPGLGLEPPSLRMTRLLSESDFPADSEWGERGVPKCVPLHELATHMDLHGWLASNGFENEVARDSEG